MINSSRLEQSSEVFPIECRVEQMMPSELNLPGQMANFRTDLRVTAPLTTSIVTTDPVRSEFLPFMSVCIDTG